MIKSIINKIRGNGKPVTPIQQDDRIGRLEALVEKLIKSQVQIGADVIAVKKPAQSGDCVKTAPVQTEKAKKPTPPQTPLMPTRKNPNKEWYGTSEHGNKFGAQQSYRTGGRGYSRTVNFGLRFDSRTEAAIAHAIGCLFLFGKSMTKIKKEHVLNAIENGVINQDFIHAVEEKVKNHAKQQNIKILGDGIFQDKDRDRCREWEQLREGLKIS